EDLAVEPLPRIVLLRTLIHRLGRRAVRGNGRRGPRSALWLLGAGGTPGQGGRDQQRCEHPVSTHRTSHPHSCLLPSLPTSVLCTSLPCRRSIRTADSVNAIASPGLSGSTSPPSWSEMYRSPSRPAVTMEAEVSLGSRRRGSRSSVTCA